jgi:ABC-type transport system involved in multi-copper enzyme maturation permease subunit
MIASYRAEAIKARKRWANWILFAILILALLAFGYVVTYLVFTHPPPRFESRIPPSVLKRETFPENLLPDVLSGMTSAGAAIMIILGGLSSASEYGWLTVQTILVQKPGRTAVLLGKLLNLAITVLLVSIAVLGAAAIASEILVHIDGSTSNFPSTTVLLKGFGALYLQLAVWTAFGVFLGIAFRSTAAAIGGGLTYLFVGEAILGQLLSNTTGVKEVLKFLPGINAGAVNAAFPLTYRSEAAAPLVSVERGVITLLIYLAVFTILSLLIFQRRDVTGA